MSEGEYDIFGEFDKSIHSDDDSNSMKQGKTSDAEHRSNVDKEGKKEPVKTRKVTRNPQLKLDPNRLCSQRGIVEVASNFKNVRLQGKGHEKSDLDLILSKMEHWAHRLFPKLPFDDCVEQIAKLGGNRIVQVHMKKFRDETDEAPEEQMNEIQETEDASLFDKIYETVNEESTIHRHTSLASEESFITQEQQNRMLENKRRAEERRKSRLMMNSIPTSPSITHSQNQSYDHVAEISSPLGIDDGEDSSKMNKTDLSANCDYTKDDDLMGIDDFIDNLPDS
nr:EOG090X0AVC [Scapholeberis mucronata]